MTQITDRAKRYRANHPDIRPSGKKRCAYGHPRNPCQGPLGVNHKDGDESNFSRNNLNWACKRHNAQLAIYHKATGQGVRTRQMNPGANNLAQYVQAAVEHTRGAHDEGGRIIHETPKARRRSFAREIAFRKSHRNPGNGSAEKLYTEFHGKTPDRDILFNLPEADYQGNPDLAQLGILYSLTVGQGLKFINEGDDQRVDYAVEDLHEDERGWERSLFWKGSEAPHVAGEPGAHQIYFIGGRQDITPMLKDFPIDPTKDLIDIGPCLLIEYLTQKPKFGDKQITPYVHGFGEESGDFIGDNGFTPRLMFHRIRKKLYLIGGVYEVLGDGIAD